MNRPSESFNARLAEELGESSIASLLDFAPLVGSIPQELELAQVPSDSVVHFAAKVQMNLPLKHSPGTPSDVMAHCELTFASGRSEFDFSGAMDLESPRASDLGCSVYLHVRLFQPKQYQLATYARVLWSKAPPRVEGLPQYVRLLL